MNQPAQTLRSPSFFYFTLTQYFGAFNDNVFKQVILLFSLEIVQSGDRQGLATSIFALPFILFSGNAGQLAEKFAKTTVMRHSKNAELVIMLLGGVGFYFRSEAILLAALFLMGAQSAYFGPAKYGAVPELVADKIMVDANGIIQMTTFLAIILGQAFAGWLLKTYASSLEMVGFYTAIIAVFGILSVYRIKPTIANRPEIQLRMNPFSQVLVTLRDMSRDKPLFLALIAGSFFFFSGAIVTLTVNNYGIKLLNLGPAGTSILLVSLALGIMIGCLSAGPFQRRISGKWTIFTGAVGVCICEASLYFYHMPLTAIHILLGLAGFFTGLYYVPIATFMQARPAMGKKGEILAAYNFSNFVGIFLAGGVWQLMMKFEVPANYAWLALSGMLAVLVALMSPQLKNID